MNPTLRTQAHDKQLIVFNHCLSSARGEALKRIALAARQGGSADALRAELSTILEALRVAEVELIKKDLRDVARISARAYEDESDEG